MWMRTGHLFPGHWTHGPTVVFFPFVKSSPFGSVHVNSKGKEGKEGRKEERGRGRKKRMKKGRKKKKGKKRSPIWSP